MNFSSFVGRLSPVYMQTILVFQNIVVAAAGLLCNPDSWDDWSQKCH